MRLKKNLKFGGDKVQRVVGGGAETLVYHYANLFVIIIYWDGIGMELFILLHLFINSAKVDLGESVNFISFRDHCRKF